MSNYWEQLKKDWGERRVDGCSCEYCHGTDICTIQQCWNKFYGNKSGGSSASVGNASRNIPPVTHGIMKCITCNEKNDYAEPNRADGTYQCFNCRC
jgi:hypothetical protein